MEIIQVVNYLKSPKMILILKKENIIIIKYYSYQKVKNNYLLKGPNPYGEICFREFII